MKSISICTLLLALALTACGGGSSQSTNTEPTFVAVPAAQLDKISCTDILALNGGNKAAALAAAQDAYRRGRTDLDGDKDGIACNGAF
jgi:Excalibur calcium-binding domain